MKKFYTTTFLVFALLSSVSVFAQRKKTTGNEKKSPIYEGYIITAKHNDTLFGEVYFLNPVYNEHTLVFYKDGEEFTYHPEQGIISEYGFQFLQYNNKTKANEIHSFVYVRKLVPKLSNSQGFTEVFVERQIHDEISLYNYYTLKTSKINSREYIHNYFIEKSGTDGFEMTTITEENYAKCVNEYLILGNNDIKTNVEQGHTTYTNLARLVVVQNAWLSGSSIYGELMEKSNRVISTADFE